VTGPRGQPEGVQARRVCPTLDMSLAVITSRQSKKGEAWPESVDLIRHHRIRKAPLQNSLPNTVSGAEVNKSDSRPLTSARSTNPGQHAVSQQRCCSPQQKIQTPIVRPTSSQPSPCLTNPCSRSPGPEAAPPRDGPAAQRRTVAWLLSAARAPVSTPSPCAPPGPRPRAPHCLQTTNVKKPHRHRTWSAAQV